MADNIVLDPGSGGATLATDDIGALHYQIVKLGWGALDTINVIDDAAGKRLPVDVSSVDVMLGTDFSAVLGSANLVATDGAAALTGGLHVLGSDGTNAQIITTDAAGHLQVDVLTLPAITGTVTANAGTGTFAVSNAGTFAVQVDGSALTKLTDIETNTDFGAVVGGGVEAAALRVTIASDSTGLISVDDSGGSLTVDHAILDDLHTADFDTGAGTDTTPAIGIALPASGGAVVGGTATNPLRTDPTGTTTQPVSGTVTANAGTGTFTVSNGGTFAVQVDGDALTALQLIDDVVSTDGSASPAKGIMLAGHDGTNAQRVITDTDGHLQVDVLSGGGARTEYSEDVAAPATIVGTAVMMERDDALATLTPIEGDWVGLRSNSRGALWVAHDGTVTVDGSAVTQPISAASLPLPTGAATETTLAAVKTSVELIDNAIAGNEMQVDVVAALPAGTNAIGKLASNDGVDIGDVTINNASVVVTNTVLTDFHSADFDTGAGTDTTAAVGIALPASGGAVVGGTSSNPIRVDVTGTTTQPVSGTVTANAGSGTFGVDLGANNDVQGAVAEGAAVSGNPFLVAGDDGTNVKNIAVDTAGNVQCDIVGALPAGTNNIGDVDVLSLPAIPAGSNNIGDVDVLTAPGTAAEAAALPGVFVVVAGDDGTDTHPLQVSAAGDLKVTLDSEAVVLGAGSASIGKLAANNGVDIGDVDVTSQPARAATTDNVGAALMTNVLHDGTTALTPKFAKIDAATSGDNTLVAAVVGKKIRVLSLFMVSTGDVLARFEDGAAGTALTGQMDLAVNSGFTLPFNPVGWFETGANTLLNLELDGAISVDGALVYVEV